MAETQAKQSVALTVGTQWCPLYARPLKVFSLLRLCRSSLCLCGKGVGREDWNICGPTTKALECLFLNWLTLPTGHRPLLSSSPSSSLFPTSLSGFLIVPSSLCLFTSLQIYKGFCLDSQRSNHIEMQFLGRWHKLHLTSTLRTNAPPPLPHAVINTQYRKI